MTSDMNEERPLYEYAARMNHGTFLRLDENPDSLLPVIIYRCHACGREHRCAIHFATVPVDDLLAPPTVPISEEAAETRQTPVDEVYSSILESESVKTFLEEG